MGKESRRARARRAESTVGPSSRLKFAVLGSVFLVSGLGWAIACGAYKWHLATKTDRLRAEGVPVTASVWDRRNNMGRGGGTDTIEVYYMYGGNQYHARILCGGPTGCRSEPPKEMILRVDPARPDEFLASNGNTDDSVAIFNAWGGIPFGLLVGAIGGVQLVAVFKTGSPRRRVTSPARRAGTAG
ncbi:hypothetical protein GCM10027290_57390 [Micromonospora sonneratiae]